MCLRISLAMTHSRQRRRTCKRSLPRLQSVQGMASAANFALGAQLRLEVTLMGEQSLEETWTENAMCARSQ